MAQAILGAGILLVAQQAYERADAMGETRRVPTQRLADWREDMSWMVAYFTFNPLAATLLAASAPSLETTCPLPWCSRRRLQPLLAQP